MVTGLLLIWEIVRVNVPPSTSTRILSSPTSATLAPMALKVIGDTGASGLTVMPPLLVQSSISKAAAIVVLVTSMTRSL